MLVYESQQRFLNTDEVTDKNTFRQQKRKNSTNSVFFLCVLFYRWASCSKAAGSLVSTSQTAGNINLLLLGVSSF